MIFGQVKHSKEVTTWRHAAAYDMHVVRMLVHWPFGLQIFRTGPKVYIRKIWSQLRRKSVDQNPNGLPLVTWLHLSNTLLGQKWLFSLVLFWPLGGTVRCYLNSSIWFLYKHTINNIFVTRIIKFLNGRWNCFCNGFWPFWNWCDCILWLPNNWCYRFLNDESYLWLMLDFIPLWVR